MSYLWNWAEQVTYNWPDWTRPWFAPWRWQLPQCDALDRPIDTTTVGAKEPAPWTDQWAKARLGVFPGTTPYEGTVGGIPMQMVNPKNTRAFTQFYSWSPWERTAVRIPMPLRDGWAHEGLPNTIPGGDRHWVGIEPDGTAHEVYGLDINMGTVGSYAVFNPDGTIRTTTSKELSGGVNKAGVQYSSHLLAPADPPHRLIAGIAGDDNDPRVWEPNHWPKVGDVAALSEEAHARLGSGADLQQRLVLDSLLLHGVIFHDHGGDPDGAGGGIGTAVAGQWAGNTLNKLDIRMGDLERVTA